MIRTQVQLTEEQLIALKALSSSERLSVAELVRRAVDALVTGKRLPSGVDRRRRALEAAGRHRSGHQDGSSGHDAHLADAFRK